MAPRNRIVKYTTHLSHEFAKAMIHNGRMPAAQRYLAGKEDWLNGIHKMLHHGDNIGLHWLEDMDYYEDWYICLFDLIAQNQYPNQDPQSLIKDEKRTFRYLNRPVKLADELRPLSYFGEWAESIDAELWALRHLPVEHKVVLPERYTIECINCHLEFQTTFLDQTTCSIACGYEYATGKKWQGKAVNLDEFRQQKERKYVAVKSHSRLKALQAQIRQAA
jgi:hypothetical protein